MDLKTFLDEKVRQFNDRKFILKDPIFVPHQFTKEQDIEIAAFFAAILAWGNRTTIIQNAMKLMQWMDHSPHQFICSHQPTDLKKMLGFKHRTFQATDLLCFIHFLQIHYQESSSLESAFIPQNHSTEITMEQRLNHFHNKFFSLEHPARTRKHIASPQRHSACKRLNMFLRWMVRKDKNQVDFGIWKNIPMHSLIIPLDVHVSRVARKLGLIENDKANWQQAFLLTEKLKTFEPEDPVKYDFALFGLGVEERL